MCQNTTIGAKKNLCDKKKGVQSSLNQTLCTQSKDSHCKAHEAHYFSPMFMHTFMQVIILLFSIIIPYNYFVCYMCERFQMKS